MTLPQSFRDRVAKQNVVSTKSVILSGSEESLRRRRNMRLRSKILRLASLAQDDRAGGAAITMTSREG